MKIELTHDILADKIYKKVSAEEKARRKVEKFVADRYEFYNGRGNLLTNNELNFIVPYLAEVDLPGEHLKFVQKGQRTARNKRMALIGFLFLLFMGLLGTLGVFVTLWQEAKDSAEKQLVLTKEAQKQTRRADSLRVIAINQTDIATAQTIEAKKQAAIAKQQTDIAKQNEIKEFAARATAEKARDAAKEAETAAIEAQGKEAIERKRADDNLKLALDRERDANRLLMLTIAQSLATKSQLTGTDSAQKKGRLAAQAYRFHTENGGETVDRAIYNGIYYGWKSFAGEKEAGLSGHTSTIRGMLPIKGGLYTTGSDGIFIRYPKVPGKGDTLKINKFVNRALAANPEQTWLAGGSDRAPFLQLFPLDKETNQVVTWQGQPAGVWSIAWGSKGCFVAGQDSVIRFSPKVTVPLKPVAKGDWRRLVLNGDGNLLAACSETNGLIIWETGGQNDSLSRVWKQIEGNFHSVAFSPDGKYFAAGDQKGKVHIWAINPGGLGLGTEYVLAGHQARVSSLAFSSNGLLASGSYDHTVQVWDLRGGIYRLNNKMPLLLDDQTDWVETIAFTPDNNSLLAGCKNGVIRRYPMSTAWLSKELCNKLTTDRLTPEEWEQYVGTLPEKLPQAPESICQ